MRKSATLVLSAVLGGCLLFGAPARTVAQDNNLQTLKFQQADVRDALAALFKSTGGSYTIDKDVQGTVTADLKGVPFETALQSLLKQVDATYRVEAGVYNIVRRPHDPIVRDPAPETVQPPSKLRIARLKIGRADPQVVYLLLTGKMGFGDGPEKSTQDLSSAGNGSFGSGGFGNSGPGGSNGFGSFGGFNGFGNQGRSGRPGTGSTGTGGNGRMGG